MRTNVIKCLKHLGWSLIELAVIFCPVSVTVIVHEIFVFQFTDVHAADIQSGIFSSSHDSD